ncbi:MAG: hypothetical protein RIG84_00990 [Roseovarius sp.]
MGVFLVGMSAIGVSAYALRDQIFNRPVVTTAIADTLPAPVVTAALGMDISQADAETSRAQPGPQLAALSLPDTGLRNMLASPLSRVFLGTPEKTPPRRPTRLGGAPLSEAERLAGLRPRVRPEALDTAPAEAEEPVRLASLAAPENFESGETVARLSAPSGLQDVQPDTAPEVSSLPAVPQTSAISGACPSRLARDIPRRSGGAKSAQAVLASVQGVDGVKRDQQVIGEILRGNVPDFLRNLVPVTISGRAGDGSSAKITICVTPDYLALGGDRDFVRLPLGLSAATRIADEFNMLLPTPRMVDMIYRSAAVRLSPSPMTPGAQMTSTAYFMRHNDTVEAQRRKVGAPAGALISGHKKDLVLTSRLASNRGRVAIYGWHRRNGQPIQPLSTVHGAGYADYSHGVRLVSRTAYLNGREVDLASLMSDARYAGLLSSEGALSRTVLASN